MEERAKKITYSTGPVPDNKWQVLHKAGKIQASYRGPPLRAKDYSRGPSLKWGSRSGASTGCKGVYFGNPGIPRSTYPSLTENPALGPPQGLGKALPKKRVTESLGIAARTHLDQTPASFVLEGVIGYNPVVAAQIRALRQQLATVETAYQIDNGSLKHELHASRRQLDDTDSKIKSMDHKRAGGEEKLKAMLETRAQLREMIDANTKELRSLHRQRMKVGLGLGDVDRPASAGAHVGEHVSAGVTADANTRAPSTRPHWHSRSNTSGARSPASRTATPAPYHSG